MNRFLFILLLVPAGAMAQEQTSCQLQDKIAGADTTHFNVNRLQRHPAALWLAQGRLSHTTDQGKVYQMPIDNMLCLVPDRRKLAKMPVVRPLPDSRMPNGFRPLPAVPKNRK